MQRSAVADKTVRHAASRWTCCKQCGGRSVSRTCDRTKMTTLCVKVANFHLLTCI